jgi:hypothetical protein
MSVLPIKYFNIFKFTGLFGIFRNLRIFMHMFADDKRGINRINTSFLPHFSYFSL